MVVVLPLALLFFGTTSFVLGTEPEDKQPLSAMQEDGGAIQAFRVEHSVQVVVNGEKDYYQTQTQILVKGRYGSQPMSSSISWSTTLEAQSDLEEEDHWREESRMYEVIDANGCLVSPFVEMLTEMEEEERTEGGLRFALSEEEKSANENRTTVEYSTYCASASATTLENVPQNDNQYLLVEEDGCLASPFLEVFFEMQVEEEEESRPFKYALTLEEVEARKPAMGVFKNGCVAIDTLNNRLGAPRVKRSPKGKGQLNTGTRGKGPLRQSSGGGRRRGSSETAGGSTRTRGRSETRGSSRGGGRRGGSSETVGESTTTRGGSQTAGPSSGGGGRRQTARKSTGGRKRGGNFDEEDEPLVPRNKRKRYPSLVRGTSEEDHPRPKAATRSNKLEFPYHEPKALTKLAKVIISHPFFTNGKNYPVFVAEVKQSLRGKGLIQWSDVPEAFRSLFRALLVNRRPMKAEHFHDIIDEMGTFTSVWEWLTHLKGIIRRMGALKLTYKDYFDNYGSSTH